MKRLDCLCGQRVFFDNHDCSHCGRRLAFDPLSMLMQAFEAGADGAPALCKHRDGPVRCNWVAWGAGPSCLSCATSRIIPALSKPANRERWRKLERAKRRLVYDLLRLDLPVEPDRLRFVFKEDRRTNPDVHDDHVTTGHLNGTITVNAAEADEVHREKMRIALNEPYRTLLGHLRHESGHYYFNVLVDDPLAGRAAALFGDFSTDYDAALARYYRDGPPQDWPTRRISSYACAHPAEDWAECWAHYLHIRAVLETARAEGLAPHTGDWRSDFVATIVSINEIMRSLGLPDPYPYVITGPVAEKIDFVHEAVERFRNRRAACGQAAG